MGIQLAEHGDVNVSLSAVVEAHDSGADDVLERFVREMHRLEGRLNFVGYSMLCNQWMLDWGMGWNENECRRLIDEYQEDGIVERHGVVLQQPRLAHVGGAVDPHQRDGAPGVGVQRRARIKRGPGTFIMARAESHGSPDWSATMPIGQGPPDSHRFAFLL